MFIIKWRNRSKTFTVTCGLGVYKTSKEAFKQVERFKTIAPWNTFYVEKI